MPPSQKSLQVAYRLNLVRQQLNVDRQPHTNVILRYSEHLQAEAGDLMLGGKTNTGAAVKAVALGLERPPGLPATGNEGKPQSGNNGPSKNSKQNPCKFWMTEKGCTRGDSCRFHHAPLDLWNPKVVGVSLVLVLDIHEMTAFTKKGTVTLKMIPDTQKKGCENHQERG